MNLPEDPVMLMSVINTELRDNYSSLESFCNAAGLDRNELEDKLAGINCYYDEKRNAFR